MKAAIIRNFGKPDVLKMEDISIPEPEGGEILVKMLSTSVNHRDVFIREGHSNPAFDVELPLVLGMDVCGVVEEVGKDVTTLKSGDRIIANPFLPCEKCDYCVQGKERLCLNHSLYNGSYAEYATIPAKNAVKISLDVPIQHAVAFSNSYITAWQMLIGKTKVNPTDTVFVWAGTSGLGSAGLEIR